MKYLVILFVSLMFVSVCQAKWVNGYTRSNGAYVSGYNRSESNNTVRDNYNYKDNNNPYTGETGTNYYKSSPSSEYYDGTVKPTKQKNWWE